MSNLSLGQDAGSDIQFPTETIYSDKSIWVGAGLGGPLVAGYIMARNFEAFDEPGKVKATWIITIIATGLIFGVAFLIADLGDFVGKAIPGIYAGVAYLLIRQHQGAQIDAHISAGGATHGVLNVAGVSIAGLVITMLPLIGIVLAVESRDTRTTRGFPVQVAYPTTQRLNIEFPTSKTYGALGHEITFLPSNISAEEIDKLASGLTKTGFLKQAPQKFLYVTKEDDNYEISISCNSTVTTDPDAYKGFVPLRKRLQKSFPRNKIILNLVVGSLDNVAKRIE
jgi:hypothetical protein